MTEPGNYELRIERTFDASAERVFDAWTSEEVLRRWFHSVRGWETPIAEVDLRVGGRIRLAMREPDGTEHAMGGEYMLIDRPHRLAMTWSFDELPGNDQTVELEFTERQGRTTVVLVNRKIVTDERRNAQDTGWRGSLDQLERLLAAT
jgi:uncharacterized protein YndB with AHSA1/START domain